MDLLECNICWGHVVVIDCVLVESIHWWVSIRTPLIKSLLWHDSLSIFRLATYQVCCIISADLKVGWCTTILCCILVVFISKGLPFNSCIHSHKTWVSLLVKSPVEFQCSSSRWHTWKYISTSILLFACGLVLACLACNFVKQLLSRDDQRLLLYLLYELFLLLFFCNNLKFFTLLLNVVHIVNEFFLVKVIIRRIRWASSGRPFFRDLSLLDLNSLECLVELCFFKEMAPVAIH